MILEGRMRRENPREPPQLRGGRVTDFQKRTGFDCIKIKIQTRKTFSSDVVKNRSLPAFCFSETKYVPQLQRRALTDCKL